MARLKSEHKTAIVTCLARMFTPTEVVAYVKEEFELTVTRQAVQAYDPTRAAGVDLSADLRDLFEAERARFLEHVEEIPIANRAYRVQKLQRLVDKLGDRQPKTTAALLEQAAKEVGQWTERKDFTSDGKQLGGGVVFYIPDNGRDSGAEGDPAAAGPAGDLPQ